MNPRITFNIGLRWEYESALTETNNGIAVFDPTSPTGLTQVGSGVKRPWNPDIFGSNIQPRFGMAWDLTGKGTTVVRAAYGISGLALLSIFATQSAWGRPQTDRALNSLSTSYSTRRITGFD